MLLTDYSSTGKAFPVLGRMEFVFTSHLITQIRAQCQTLADFPDMG